MKRAVIGALGGFVALAVTLGMYEFGRRSPEVLLEAIALLVVFGIGALVAMLIYGEPR